MKFFNKTVRLILFSLISLYFAGIFGIKTLIDQGYTNVESESIDEKEIKSLTLSSFISSQETGSRNLQETGTRNLFDRESITHHESAVILSTTSIIPASMREVHKYIKEHPADREAIEYTYAYLHGTQASNSRLPQDSAGLNFILEGIDVRKKYLTALQKYSTELNVDPDIVLACILGEQIRIAHAGVRNTIKEVATRGTPALFRSENVSLGIGGIKLYTATLIRKDALVYGYGSGVVDDHITEYTLTNDDDFNAKYAVYLVKNILTRRKNAGYDISDNPGVICTLYNMGNHPKKQPHADPEIGGSVIKIQDQRYVYGGISMGMYRYLKIYK